MEKIKLPLKLDKKMKLIDSYALQSGLKISEPFLYSAFFPNPFDKYITLQNSSGMEGKNYDYWQEVVDLIFPFLQEEGIVILQLGDKKTESLKNCINLGGSTSIAQTNFLLKGSLAHLGNDSWLIHLAGALNKPLVGLYGATNPQNHGPSFGDKNNQFLIESHRFGNKPSFEPNESPKTINLINPEEVAKVILKILGFPDKIARKTLYIGEKYKVRFLEIVMDTVLNPNAFPGALPVARMDYLFDENILANNLQNRPFGIITNKPININLIKTFRKNIAAIIYLIEEDYSVQFVKDLTNNGIPYQLRTYINGDNLGKLKLEFFDYGIIECRSIPVKENLENFDKMDNFTLCKSNKFILSRDKIFLTKKLWEQGKNTNSFEENSFNLNLEEDSFLKEIEHFYIYHD